MKTRDFLVGLTFFGLLAVLAAFTIFLADFSFGQEFRLSIPFTDVGGLTEGAEVRVDGLMVGRVRGIERRPGEKGIFVVLAFEEDPKLPDDATYAITSASALGGRVVEIFSDSQNGIGKRAPDGETWRGPGPNAMDAITKLVRDNEDKIQKAIGNIEAITAGLAETGDDGRTLAQKIRDTVDNLDAISKRLKDGEGLIGRLTKEDDGGLEEDLALAVASIRKFSVALADEEGPLFRLATNQELAGDVTQVVADIKDLTRRVKEGQGVVGMLFADEKVRGKVVDAITALNSVATKLDSGENVLAGIFGADAKVLTQALVSLNSAARRIEMATANLDQKNNIIGMLLTDSEAAKEVRNSIRSLSDFIETTRENAPITTFAGILLSPF